MSSRLHVRLRQSVTAGSLVLAIATPRAAFAQSAPAADDAKIASDAKVEDVIVTATRRSEPLQKVPVAVSVVEGRVAERSNLNNLRDLSSIIPSLNFRTAASNKDQALFVRGFGTVSTSPGVEPSASTVIDGVVMARQGQATLDLLDIDRVEVLRGPQGTLFGKNASAGVINIVTRNPGDEFHLYGDAFYGTGGDERRFKAGISGPIIPGQLGASINFLFSDYDGNVKNVWNGQSVNGYGRDGVRGKMVFQPTEDLKLTLNADYVRSTDTTPQGAVTRAYLTAYPTNAVTFFPSFASALLPVTPSAYNRQINSNYETSAHDRNGGVSLQGDWTVDGHTFTSISAWRRWDNTQYQDQDRLPAVIVGGPPQQHDVGNLSFEQVSQELRVASPKGRFLEYVAGGYFMRAIDRETYARQTTTLTGATQSTFFGDANYGVTNTNYSGFGEATLNFMERFRGIAGVRVVKDDLQYHFQRISTSPTPVQGIQTSFAAGGSKQEVGLAGRAGLQYDFSDTAMGYATYSRGYKGPAYNIAFSMLPQDTSALKPETNNSYEVGLKARFFDGRLQTNLAGFITDFSNYQVNFFDTYNGSRITRLINAGKVSTRGVEADIEAHPIPELTLGTSVAYTRARIGHFNCPVGTNASCDVDGKTLPFAPDWKINVRANYRMILTDALTLELSTDVLWQSKVQYSINQTPDTVQANYGIWNAGVAVISTDGWRLGAIVKNITNTHYSSALSTISNGVVRFVPRDDQRYFGFNLRKDFM